MVTRLESPAFFEAHLAKALAQARRYRRRVALLVARPAPSAGDAARALRRAAFPILENLRTSDAASIQEGELRVLLPETDRLGALLLHHRLLRSVPELTAIRLGSAAFPEDEGDAEALLGLARRRGKDSEASLGSVQALRSLGFRETMRQLLSSPGRVTLSSTVLRDAKREALLELERSSTVRGIVALDGGHAEEVEQLWEALPSHRLAGRVFVAQAAAHPPPRHPSLTHVPVEDERFGFLLFLSGHAALTLLRDAEGHGFLSTDLDLACHLVSGFREEFGLREGIE